MVGKQFASHCAGTGTGSSAVSSEAADRSRWMHCSQKRRTEIYYDKTSGKLVMDVARSGFGCWKIKEEAPFILLDSIEKLDVWEMAPANPY